MRRNSKVRVTLNDLNASDEVLRISAWDISTLVQKAEVLQGKELAGGLYR